MPIYEFKCRECKHVFEVIAIGEILGRCPKCGTLQVQKLMSAPAIAKLKEEEE